MEDMNMDCDIEDDPIKKFLLHKLEEIKLNNSELEQQINRRKELLNKCLTNAASEFGHNVLEISSTWQRTLNNKWIIGIKMKNTNNTGVLSNINLILKWDSSLPLTYKTKTFTRYKPEQQEQKTFLPERLEKIAKALEKTSKENQKFAENEWICSDEIKEYLVVVAVFDVPEFIAKAEYNISGALKYQFKESNCQLNLPTFCISVKDVINRVHSIKEFDVWNGEEEAFLASLTANEEYELIACTSKNSYTSLDNFLEFECMLKRVNVNSETKKWFFKEGVPGNTSDFLFSLQHDDNVFNLNVFTMNRSSLELFLHFLYQNVSDILLLPKEHKQVLSVMTEEVDENKSQASLRQFGKSLESQIKLIETFCNKSTDTISSELVEQNDEIDLNVTIQKYQTFREQLAGLEFTSDMLYAEIEKYTTKSEFVTDDNNI